MLPDRINKKGLKTCSYEGLSDTNSYSVDAVIARLRKFYCTQAHQTNHQNSPYLQILINADIQGDKHRGEKMLEDPRLRRDRVRVPRRDSYEKRPVLSATIHPDIKRTLVSMSKRTGMSVSQVADEVLYTGLIKMHELDAPGE